MNDEIKIIEIDDNYDYINKVKDIYNYAFPEEERLAFDELLFLEKTGLISVRAILCGENPIGLMSYLTTDDVLYLLYIAIDSSIRGKGYGSRVFEELSEFSSRLNRGILLSVEPLIETVSNYEQRLKRVKFYEKFGFKLAGEPFEADDNVWMQYMSDKKLSKDFIIKQFHQMSQILIDFYEKNKSTMDQLPELNDYLLHHM